MNSFRRESVELPLSAVWLTNAIAEYKGKQELYTKQSPQLLRTLLETALIESIVEQSRETYYEALRRSSRKWHEARHELLPWLNYFLGTVLAAYKELEDRAADAGAARGAKTRLLRQEIGGRQGAFSISDFERACPAVSRVMIKKVLGQMKKNKEIECLGKGQSAKWRRMAY